MATNERVHFFHFDNNSCGSRKPMRRVSPDVSGVTCPRCLHNYWHKEGLVLTSRGEAYVRELNAKHAS